LIGPLRARLALKARCRIPKLPLSFPFFHSSPMGTGPAAGSMGIGAFECQRPSSELCWTVYFLLPTVAVTV
jgi:hypothetical protein